MENGFRTERKITDAGGGKMRGGQYWGSVPFAVQTGASNASETDPGVTTLPWGESKIGSQRRRSKLGKKPRELEVLGQLRKKVRRAEKTKIQYALPHRSTSVGKERPSGLIKEETKRGEGGGLKLHDRGQRSSSAES